jgi:putative ABC transport system substrate-binding protein
MLGIGRREFITFLGGAAVWPIAARGQQTPIPVVGYLAGGLPESAPAKTSFDVFRKGLGETGYLEGRTVAIESRWAKLQYDRLPELAADLVRREVALIVASGTLQTSLAAKRATSTIPIVFSVGVDPVRHGLVASVRRPGGNLTGTTNLNTEVASKRLELLHEMVPQATKFGLLVNPTNPDSEIFLQDMKTAARVLRLEVHVFEAGAETDLAESFSAMTQMKVSGLVVGVDGVFVERSEQLAALALRHALPTIFTFREFPAAGGLMSYGSSREDQAHLTGVYAGRVLKGEKPAELPVLRATRVELIINMKTAKALGLTVPLTLRGRADELIE